MERPLHETLMDLALKRNFLIPSNELYGKSSGFYDYGPVGFLLKKKIENAWRDFFVRQEGFHEIETVHIIPEDVLKASGHVSSFADPLVACNTCKNRFRADSLLEEKTGKKYEGLPPNELTELIKENKVQCPRCGGGLGSVGWFNLMFRTNIGSIDGDTAYARPETAQGIFLDFQRIHRNSGSRLPMGIAQVGRSYRNEISPRQGILRLREFTQMEIEYFFDPKDDKMEGFSSIADKPLRLLLKEGEEIIEVSAKDAVKNGLIPNEIMAYFMAKQTVFYEMLGVPFKRMHFKLLPEKEMPHYSKKNFDLCVDTSFGSIETVGNAYRGDFDLSSHGKASGNDLSIVVDGKKIIPHVIEPSMGVDRMLWCILEHCYRPKTKEKEWEWFDFPPIISPYEAAVFPLMKRDGMGEKAKEVARGLRDRYDIFYSESGSIGRRYAKADEIGLFLAITVDYDTLNDGTVTMRERNSAKQIRVKISDLADKIDKLMKGEIVFIDAGVPFKAQPLNPQ
jgi:glycyl-tRNA synthetase